MLVILLLMVAAVSHAADKPWGRGKMVRYYRKYIVREKDPQKLKTALIDASDHTTGRARIFFQLALAEQYARSGDLALAEKTYREAYDFVRQAKPRLMKSYLPFGMGTMYDAYERLAYFYLSVGNLNKAEALFNESRAVRDSIFPERSIHRVQPIVGLGSVHFRQGNFDKTYTFFNEAIEKRNRATTTHFDYDNINRLFLSDLAELCMALGRNDEAGKHIDNLGIASSGAMKFTSNISRRLEVARIFELKARYYLLQGNFEKAQRYLEKADEYNPGKQVVSDVQFKILKTRTLLWWHQGDFQKANESFTTLVQTYRTFIGSNFSAMSEYERERFYNTLKQDFNLFNAYVFQQHATKPGALFAEMYDNVVNTKALLLTETNKQKARIRESGDTKLITMLSQWEEAKTQISSQFFGGTSPARLDSLQRFVEGLEKQLAGGGLFAASREPVSWRQIQKKLSPGEVAVEIVRVNVASGRNVNGYAQNSGLSDSAAYAILVVRPESVAPEFHAVANGGSMERKSVIYYRNAIFGRVEDNISYAAFWSPIKAAVGDANRIYVSRDGVYNQLNLNTLRNSSTGKYVIDELELIYLTNTADLLRDVQNTRPLTNAVLVGRPHFRLENASLGRVEETTGIAFRDVISDEIKNFKAQSFLDLPGTETEIQQIRDELVSRQVDTRVLMGADALEENVKKISRPSVLHIATHGFFVDDRAGTINPMIRSGLVLAGVQNGNRMQEDGILTAYEATNLDLEQTNLVVLSACQTGVGEIRNNEGVYGLQRAIIVAGAQNLIMSLWKVDDAATAELMVLLYKKWSGTNNANVFREAQLELRSRFPQPIYWGAFVMLGY